ncbi:MAG: hypothetical protein JXR84_27725 [Anaerolineae bacterium]|nr:hypothetical protein [Anaerolineae bacterium]
MMFHTRLSRRSASASRVGHRLSPSIVLLLLFTLLPTAEIGSINQPRLALAEGVTMLADPFAGEMPETSDDPRDTMKAGETGVERAASMAVPVANFSADPTSGSISLPVQFTDESTNDPTGWAWYFGDERFTGSWTQLTASAPWSSRSNHTSVVLPDGNIVLMGGYDGDYRNDVWRSLDQGATWTQMTASAAWTPRYGHNTVALPDGSIVLMGGRGEDIRYNDVWRSTDQGATWTQIAFGARWSPRRYHTSVVLPDGDIVLMGGVGYNIALYNDVWCSTDQGATWTQMTASAAWSPRGNHSTVMLSDGSIMLIGGQRYNGVAFNDVWRSTDQGATWMQMTASAAWSPRSSHSSVVLPDDSIVLMGGYDNGYRNDIWRSTDKGATWTQLTYIALWPGRCAHASVSLPDGSIVLMGGYDGSHHWNDVWRLETSGSTEQHPAHTYGPGVYQVALQAYNTDGYSSMRRPGYINVSLADFMGNPTSGLAPLDVQFTDQSINNPTGWAWYFGDETFDEPWLQMNEGAAWSARHGHSSVTLPDGSIVLMSGYGGGWKSDVWRSVDQGATWTQMTDSVLTRSDFSSVALSDGSIVLMGGQSGSVSMSDVWRSTDQGATWTQMTALAEWQGRQWHSSVALPDGSIVLMGGRHESIEPAILNDVWRSTDQGATWTQMTANVATWPVGENTSVTLPDGSIVLINRRYVWRSTDQGATWTQMSQDAGWTIRYGHTSVALPDGSIVLMGGNDGSYLNDVWRSTDQGATWTQMTASAEWSPRRSHASVALPDGSIALMGGYDGSDWDDVWRSTDQGATWTQLTTSVAWTARRSHASVVLPDDKNIVMMGGYDGSQTNDVWRSNDRGTTWIRAAASAEWTPRDSHSAVALPDKSIVLMGGYDGDCRNDVWRSTDQGATWTQMTEDAGWTARYGHTSVVLPDSSIVLMGGNDGDYRNDVWRSTDRGATWTQLTNNAGWSPRWDHASVALPDGGIVLMGGWDGSLRNDVWWSIDQGASWTQMAASAEWTPRQAHTGVSLPDGSIIMMGGRYVYSAANDVWRSTDRGLTWTEISPSVEWMPRGSHSSVIMHNGDIVVMGGVDGNTYRHNVWRLETAGSTEQYPAHTYTESGSYQVALQAYSAYNTDSTRKVAYIDVTMPEAPSFTSPDSTTLTVGTMGSFTVIATGVPTPTISATGALPGVVVFSPGDDGTATLAGTPVDGSTGTFPLTFTASNGILPDASQIFTLTVKAVQAEYPVFLPLVLRGH